MGDNVKLTATENPGAAGTVQFMDGSNNLGSPGDGQQRALPTTRRPHWRRAHTVFRRVFTPTDTTAYVGSTGTLTQVVNPAANKTTTSLAVNQDGTAGDDATLSATVVDSSSAPVNAGSVSFYDGTSTTPLGTVAGSNAQNGVYTLDLPNGFTSGQHSIVAKFTPTDTTVYTVSQSSAQSFTTSAKQGTSVTNDPQGVTVTVPSGTIVISTPYTAANPLNLGTMSLNSSATEFTASGTFSDIKVTDMRSGSLGYTVSALSNALTDGSGKSNGTINAENVGLTGLNVTPGAGYAGTTTTDNNPAADPAVAPGDTGSKGLGGDYAARRLLGGRQHDRHGGCERHAHHQRPRPRPRRGRTPARSPSQWADQLDAGQQDRLTTRSGAAGTPAAPSPVSPLFTGALLTRRLRQIE